MQKKESPFTIERKRGGKKFLFWLIPVIAAAAFFVIFLSVGIAGQDKFFGNTYVGETKIGGKTITEANDILKSNTAITITTKDGDTETISLSSIDYTSDYTEGLSEIKNSQPFLLSLFNSIGKKEYEVKSTSSYDESKLNKAIENLSCVSGSNIQAPVNAHIGTDSDNNFVIIDAVEGNQINVDRLKEVVKNNLNNGVFSVNLNSNEDVYNKPTVYADNEELKSTYEKVKNLKNVVITLDMTNATETVDVSVYKDWINTNDNSSIFDRDKVVAYLDELAEKYDTYMTNRKFPASGIGTITVYGTARDTYGFKMDVGETADTLIEALESQESKTIEPIWSTPALTRNAANGSNDIGDTYVEIDISRQHMWYYVNGQVYLETDIRSGEESEKRYAPTPSGVFRILSKSREKDFLDFEPVVHSSYWMPFDWEGCGIHDASWFSTFGGNLYLTSGSHGCINTPISIVEPMYNSISVGTPVIVYRSAEYTSTSNT